MPQKRHSVRFLPDDVTIDVYREAENLLRVAMVAGVHVNASCGGAGTCGKCKVRIPEGEHRTQPSSKLSAGEWDDGYRLACQTEILGDLVVEVPVESRYEKAVLARKVTRATVEHVLSAARLGAEFAGEKPDPAVTKVYCELSPPTEESNVSDMGRLGQVLKRDHGIARIGADYPVLRTLSSTLREGAWKTTATVMHTQGSHRLLRVEPGDTRSRVFALAIDIGTTTIHAALLDVNEGTEVARAGDYNSQVSMGEDVITRIVAALKPGGLDALQKRVVKTINGVVQEVLEKAQAAPEEISHVVLGGNTTMTQLFLALNPKYIREAPYVPAANFFPPFRVGDLGIRLPEHVMGYAMPCVASYVGGDITAGVLATGIHLNPELTLFMDVGTNGEIVIGNQDWMVSASASAGPAFEGGGVKFGMRATFGAIEQVRVNPADFEPMLLTIGQTKPKGVCGSGMIDCLSEFLEVGLISQNGKFNGELAPRTPRLREGETGWEYVLCWEEQSQLDQDIVITEPDMDNLIRTKASIYAACSVLLKSVGLSLSDVEKIIIAGGFGQYIDVEKAMAIGLLPEVNPEIVRYGGNTSLAGCTLATLYRDKIEEAESIATMITNIELSASPIYMEEYVAALFLPHTRMEDFPQQARRLEALRRPSVPAPGGEG
ncbi:MAG: ASKHA domain-containing protein [Thermodesulfobacteriota bacterium]